MVRFGTLRTQSDEIVIKQSKKYGADICQVSTHKKIRRSICQANY
jgi:hypothetical protein